MRLLAGIGRSLIRDAIRYRPEYAAIASSSRGSQRRFLISA
jgi:hypothetical protein